MKPALMTTTVAVVGLIPAAMSTAIGAQSQRPLALVIVGGLIPGVMLALIVLPAMYELFEYGFRRTPKPEEALKYVHPVRTTNPNDQIIQYRLKVCAVTKTPGSAGVSPAFDT